MAEITSRQAARIAAGKSLPSDYGKVRCVVTTSPATAAWADGDIVASGQRLPPGTRFMCNSFASHDAMGASVLLDVGIRDWVTKVAIDADGIASGIDVSAAGRDALHNGDLVKIGAESQTTVASEVYFTLRGAAATANKQIRVDVVCLVPG